MFPFFRTNRHPTSAFDGKRAEARARQYLESRGLTLLAKNFRTRFGEIDIVMRDGDTLVFVEVRFRAQRGFADPLESVDGTKQQKLLRTAATYLAKHPHCADIPVRFDVVGIAPGNSDNGTLQWLRDAFRA